LQDQTGQFPYTRPINFSSDLKPAKQASLYSTCEAGDSIKPGAQAPGNQWNWEREPAAAGESAVARFRGLQQILWPL